jgi:protein TonB
MRAFARLILSASLALALAACSDAPPPGEAPPGASTAAAVAAPVAPPLDAEALRNRAAASLAANRLYSPAGDNAVEDYLGLLERQPGDATVETALADLAPYVIIGAEQATAAGDVAEAERLVALLTRMDDSAPAAPRLRESLAAARLAAEAEAEADAEAEAAAQRQAEPTEATAADAPSAEVAEAAEAVRPAPTPAALPAPPPPVAAPVAAAPAASAALANAPPASAPPARALLSRVPARFPESALRRRLEGEVEVAVSIRPDGSVASVDVVRADPPGVFDREAVLAVRRWRYAPADAPSEARVVLQFRRPS